MNKQEQNNSYAISPLDKELLPVANCCNQTIHHMHNHRHIKNSGYCPEQTAHCAQNMHWCVTMKCTYNFFLKGQVTRKKILDKYVKNVTLINNMLIPRIKKIALI